MMQVWAAVPVKEFTGAKQRLAALLTPEQREMLAATMLEDVLAALAGARRLARHPGEHGGTACCGIGGPLRCARGHGRRA